MVEYLLSVSIKVETVEVESKVWTSLSCIWERFFTGIMVIFAVSSKESNVLETKNDRCEASVVTSGEFPALSREIYGGK